MLVTLFTFLALSAGVARADDAPQIVWSEAGTCDDSVSPVVAQVTYDLEGVASVAVDPASTPVPAGSTVVVTGLEVTQSGIVESERSSVDLLVTLYDGSVVPLTVAFVFEPGGCWVAPEPTVTPATPAPSSTAPSTPTPSPTVTVPAVKVAPKPAPAVVGVWLGKLIELAS